MKQGQLFGSEPPQPPAVPSHPQRRPPVDDDARRAAVTEFERPLLLAAGAGTGKTATLVARVLQWCLGPGWERAASAAREAGDADAIALTVLRGVAAITFTEAAAAEMSTRAANALARVERAAAGAAIDVDALPIGLVPESLPSSAAELLLRAQSLRSALDHLAISTIHAFCRRLLAAHPLAIGLDPGFEVDATFARVNALVREVVERYLEEAWSEPVDTDLVALAAANHGPPEIEEALIQLVESGARAADFTADPLGPEVVAGLERDVAATLAALAESAAKLAGLGGNTEIGCAALAQCRAALADLPEGSAHERLRALCNAVRAVWKADERAWKRLKEWKDPNKRETLALGAERELFVERAGALRTALEPLLDLDVELLERTRKVIGRLLGEIESELRRRGIATFADLLVDAKELLRAHPDVAARERRRLAQLLVDEFQDTDELQCELVRRLALEGPADERPGLFVVGDPKQSIFAWRNADLEAFDAFRDDLLAAGGRELELTANFRSRAAILAEVERSVEPVMEHQRGVQPAFVALAPGRPDAHEPARAGSAAIEFWVSWTRDDEVDAITPALAGARGESYELEARAVAQDLTRERAKEGARWSDFALVFRALTQIEPYLQELRQAHIPYEVQSDRKYYRRREIVDATALVRAVLDPHDQVALVTLLRAPCVGVPDAALLPLWEQGLPGRLAWLLQPDDERLATIDAAIDAAVAKTPTSVPGLAAISGWDASLKLAVRALADARRAFRDAPADSFVDRLRATFLCDATESARFLGAYRLANLERFFREVERALELAGGDAQAVLRTLRSNVQRDDRSEASRPGDSDQDAVQVLTIHGAKGLEFRHVYLLQTHKQEPQGGSGLQFDRRGSRVAYKLFGTASPSWAEAERDAKIATAAERVRLYYVALTRACERLVVAGVPPAPEKAKPWRSERSTFADLLSQRAHAGPALCALAERAAQDDFEPWVDPEGAVWRLTAGLARSTPQLAPGMVDVALVTAGEPLEVVTPARRARARTHAHRRWQSAASDEGHTESAEARAERRFGSEHDSARAGAHESTRELEREELEPLGRSAAQAVGTVLHALFEELVLADVERSWDALSATLSERLEDVPPDEREAALARGRDLAERVRAGGFLERLAEIAPHVVARELPVLAPLHLPLTGADDDEIGELPVAFHSGAIDLVYRDPGTGALVVVDYKTDRAQSEDEFEALAARYAAQGRIYTRALQAALQLDREPRFELWFLHAGRTLIAPSTPT